MKRLETVKDLNRYKGKNAKVILLQDEDTEMAELWIDDVPVMSGNYWDFHPYCMSGFTQAFGREVAEYASPREFADLLTKELNARGAKAVLENREYSADF